MCGPHRRAVRVVRANAHQALSSLSAICGRVLRPGFSRAILFSFVPVWLVRIGALRAQWKLASVPENAFSVENFFAIVATRRVVLFLNRFAMSPSRWSAQLR